MFRSYNFLIFPMLFMLMKMSHILWKIILFLHWGTEDNIYVLAEYCWQDHKGVFLFLKGGVFFCFMVILLHSLLSLISFQSSSFLISSNTRSSSLILVLPSCLPYKSFQFFVFLIVAWDILFCTSPNHRRLCAFKNWTKPYVPDFIIY